MKIKRKHLNRLIETYLGKQLVSEGLYDIFKGDNLKYPSKTKRKEIALFLKVEDAANYKGTGAQNIALEKAIEDAGGPKSVINKMKAETGDERNAPKSGVEKVMKQQQQKKAEKDQKFKTSSGQRQSLRYTVLSYAQILGLIEEVFRMNMGTKDEAEQLELALKELPSKGNIANVKNNTHNSNSKILTQGGKKKRIVGNSDLHIISDVFDSRLINSDNTLSYSAEAIIKGQFSYLPARFQLQNRKLKGIYTVLQNSWNDPEGLSQIPGYAESLYDLQINKAKEHLSIIESVKMTFDKKKKAKAVELYKNFIITLEEDKQSSANQLKSLAEVGLSTRIKELKQQDKVSVSNSKLFLKRHGMIDQPV